MGLRLEITIEDSDSLKHCVNTPSVITCVMRPWEAMVILEYIKIIPGPVMLMCEVCIITDFISSMCCHHGYTV